MTIKRHESKRAQSQLTLWIALVLHAACAGQGSAEDSDAIGGRSGNELPLCSVGVPQPNDTLEEAAPFGANAHVRASVCSGGSAFFRLGSPVASGGVFLVSVESEEGSDVLGLVVGSSSTGVELWSQSPSKAGRQRIGVVSDGGAYWVQVMALGVPAGAATSVHAYTLSIGAAPPARNDCCSASGDLGCSDSAVSGCLCQQDNDCCSRSYDDLCVTEAVSLCGLRCEQGTDRSGCCTASASSGCLDEEVEACVCRIDPYCCAGSFDENCVRLAENQCLKDCPVRQSEAQ
jgi:hypothetical protein